jgi:hypothetical protein
MIPRLGDLSSYLRFGLTVTLFCDFRSPVYTSWPGPSRSLYLGLRPLLHNSWLSLILLHLDGRTSKQIYVYTLGCGWCFLRLGGLHVGSFSKSRDGAGSSGLQCKTRRKTGPHLTSPSQACCLHRHVRHAEGPSPQVLSDVLRCVLGRRDVLSTNPPSHQSNQRLSGFPRSLFLCMRSTCKQRFSLTLIDRSAGMLYRSANRSASCKP